MTQGAFRRISSLLQRDDLRTALRRKEATIRALEAALDGATLRMQELEELIERMRDDAGPVYESEQQLRARVRFLEAEREWKPWPPEVRDGRRILYCNPGSRVLTIMTARSGIGHDPPGFYRELGPVPGDDYA